MSSRFGLTSELAGFGKGNFLGRAASKCSCNFALFAMTRLYRAADTTGSGREPTGTLQPRGSPEPFLASTCTIGCALEVHFLSVVVQGARPQHSPDSQTASRCVAFLS